MENIENNSSNKIVLFFKNFKSFFTLTNSLLLIGGLLISSGIMSIFYTKNSVKKFPVNIAIYTNANSIHDSSISNDKEFPAKFIDRCSVISEKSKTYIMMNTKIEAQRYIRSEEPQGSNFLTLQAGMSLFVTSGKNPVTGKVFTYRSKEAGKQNCNDALSLSYVDISTVDRKTAEPIENGKKLSGNKVAVQEVMNTYDAPGLPLNEREGFSYQLPFNVQKDKSYKMFDTLTRKTSEMQFVDEKKIGEYNTYHYKVIVPETNLAEIMDGNGDPDLGAAITKPASWWRIKNPGIDRGDNITLNRFIYQEKDIWVEPKTGKILDGKDYFHQYYKLPEFKITKQNKNSNKAKQSLILKDFKVDAFKAKLVFSEKTISDQIKTVDEGYSQLNLLEKYLPIALFTLGIIFAGVGFIFVRRKK